MDSFHGAAAGAAFCYGSPRAESSMADVSDHNGDEEAFCASLDVYVHHARDIHNICIYANQDVYAKFSLTCSPDEAVATRIVAGGGRNPQFEERLRVKVTQPDAVLKCEVWMLSRARNYLEDQLLGFTLVPLPLVAAADGAELTQDFALSSTDLFHSPAGNVLLTLSLDVSRVGPSGGAFAAPGRRSSISSEVVILDPAVDYGAIEFPDISIAKENQKMVSEYFDMAAAAHGDGCSACREVGGAGTAAAGQFLHLGAPNADHDMNSGSSDSPDGSVHNSGPFSVSTTTSLSDDRASANSSDKRNLSNETHHNSDASQPDTPTSRNGGSTGEPRPEPTKLLNRGDDGADQGEQRASGSAAPPMASVFAAPLGDINVQAEQSAMQQQIVDMYMKSMQQFTESLAKMKLPMDLHMPSSEDGGVVQSRNNSSSSSSNRSDANKRKDGPRVFYGSRAFF